MYEQFFGFRERPFDLTPNPRYLVPTESHREVLSNLEYAIASRKGVTVVVGEAGSGKTTLIRKVIGGLGPGVHSVHINNPTLTRDEFIQLLAGRFGLSPAAAQSKAVFLEELERLLRHRHAQGETTVLVVDEAQSLPIELLEEIRLLGNTETNDEKLLQVILVGQPELADRLNEVSLRQLKQRVGLRCELHPLSESETSYYLYGRILVAGGSAAQVFTRDAVMAIHKASRGIPRLVSVVADNALLGAFARGQRPVTRDIVAEVCRDFDLASHSEDAALARRPTPPSDGRLTTGNVDVASVPASTEEAGPLVSVPPQIRPSLFSIFTRRNKR